MRTLFWVHLAAGLSAAVILDGCNRQSGSGRGRPGAGEAVLIQAARAQAKDTPIYLDGIGTVQAFNTVTVHTQVSGVLQQVAFREGQDVKAGDLLAEVDPRTYQAELDQAKAKQAEDQAQADNAVTTYKRNFSLLAKGLIDQQTVDTDKSAADQFNATVQADAAAVEQAQVMLGYTRITWWTRATSSSPPMPAASWSSPS
jgi:multidrug efflux system membrane fusion protein